MRVKNINHFREYWVCDVALACGDTLDNVFKYTFSHEGNPIRIPEYFAFTTKKEAVALSKQMLVNPDVIYEVD